MMKVKGSANGANDAMLAKGMGLKATKKGLKKVGGTEIARKLGMPSATGGSWAAKENRINVGASVFIQGKSRRMNHAERETAEGLRLNRKEREDMARSAMRHDGSDSSDLDMSDDEAEIMARIRSKRLNELRAQSAKVLEWKSMGHGEYGQVAQDDFLATVTRSKYCVCHFFHKEFTRCEIMDKHLRHLAPQHLPTRFFSIDAEKSPFFVKKLAIRTLPTLIFFKDGIAIDRMVGFADVGGKDDFSTFVLSKRLAKAGVILSKEQQAKLADSDGEDDDEAEVTARAGTGIRKGLRFGQQTLLD